MERGKDVLAKMLARFNYWERLYHINPVQLGKGERWNPIRLKTPRKK